MKSEIYYGLFLFTIAIIPVIIFMRANEYNNIERYYYNKNKELYIVLKLTFYFLILAAIVNIRFLVFAVISHIWTKYKRIWKRSK